MKRVVITGLGFVSSCGSDKDKLWDMIEQSYKKPEFITKFNASNISSHKAFELGREFCITDYTGDSRVRRKKLYSQMVAASGVKALEDAKLTPANYDNLNRIGSILTTLNGPIEVTFKYLNDLIQGGPKMASPDLFQQSVFNVAGGQLSLLLGLKGVSSTLVGCSSIQYAYDLIRSGRADVILAGGMEELHQHIYYAYNKQSMLAVDNGDGELSIPLSSRANGVVLGEGCGIAVLESLEHAEQRNARIYAELVGSVSLTDEVFNKDFRELGNEKSNGFFRAMDSVIKKNNLSTNDIDLISLAANSHPEVDKSELMAILNICKADKAEWSAVASKAFLGETLGNSEMFSLLSALMCFEKNRIPGLKYLQGENGIKSTLAKSKEKIHYGIVNSFFIGGGISCLLLKRI